MFNIHSTTTIQALVTDNEFPAEKAAARESVKKVLFVSITKCGKTWKPGREVLVCRVVNLDLPL